MPQAVEALTTRCAQFAAAPINDNINPRADRWRLLIGDLQAAGFTAAAVVFAEAKLQGRDFDDFCNEVLDCCAARGIG